MAKKTDEFEFEDFNLDSELDMGDFDASSEKVKDDRSPALKLSTTFVGGVKDGVLNESFVRNTIKDNFPRGYGQAYDLAEESVGTLRNLYNTTAQELKPVVKDMKRSVNRLMPLADTILPRSISDKIKEWSKEDADKRDMSVEEQRDSSINMQLADIFKLQAETQVKDKAEGEAKENVREQISHKRHLDQLGQLDAIRVGMGRLTEYQDKVAVNYQRKSLELQYRHYFVAMDSLEEQKKQNAIVETKLEGILKNTGLPEFVKIKDSERFKEALRNRFIDGIQDSVFSNRRNFLKDTSQRLVSSVKNRVVDFGKQIRDGLGMAEMLAEMQEMQKDMGMETSLADMGSNMAGESVGLTIGNKIGKWMGKFARRFDFVNEKGNDLAFFAQNLPQIAWDWAQSDKHEDNPFGGLVRLAKDAVGRGATDYGLENDSIDTLQGPAIFSNQTRKTINEIIPGFLSRIYQELQIIRTGDTSIERTVYDFQTNDFSGAAKVKKAVFNALIPKEDVQRTKEESASLVDTIDPNKTLSPEARSVLEKQLLRDNMANKVASPDNLSSYEHWSGESGRYADEYAELFKNYFKDDKVGNKKVSFARDFGSLGRWMGDIREKTQNMVNAGYGDMLKEIGLIDEKGNIDPEKLYGFSGGDEYEPTRSISDNQGMASFKRVNTRIDKKKENRIARFFKDALAEVRGDNMTTVVAPGQVGEGGLRPDVPAGMSAKFSDDCCKNLLDSMEKNSVKSETQSIIGVLNNIKSRMDSVFDVNVIGETSVPGKGERSVKKRWWQYNVGDLGTDIGNAASWLGRKSRDLTNNTFDNLNKARKFTTDKISSLWKWGTKKKDDFFEIYIKGELEPRLSAYKLQAKQYWDVNSQKVIEKVEDITGPVKDLTTDKIVLQASELKDSFIKSERGQKLVGFMDKVKKLPGKVVDALYAPIPGAIGVVKDLFKKGMDLIDGPIDIYIKGKEDPVLLAITMKAGGYRSRITGLPITKPSEIDGVVLDDRGDVVLTAEQLAGGLFDKKGRPVRTGHRGVFGFAKDVAKWGIDKTIGAAKWVGDQVKGAWDGATGFLGGIFGKVFGEEGVVFAGSRKMINVIEEIRNILLERLPEPKKRVIGDITGDGVREGSWQDLLNKDNAKKEKEAEERSLRERLYDKGSSIYGMGAAGLKSLWDRLSNKGDEEGGGDVNIDLGDRWGGSDGGDDKKKRRGKGKNKRTPPPKGFWNKTKHYGKRGLGSLWNGAKWLGRGAGNLLLGRGGMGMAGMLGRGTLLAGAGTGLAAGAGAIGSGLMGLGGLALSGLGAVAGGIASVLSAPVVIGGLAAAAIGYGLYKGYKYLTRKKLTPLSTVRYAQYGFVETEEEFLEKVFGLEDKLMKAVSFKDGTAELGQSGLDLKEIIEDFGVDVKDSQAVESWLQWFSNRFKPVFLTHLTALKKTNPETKLEAIEELSKADKTKYLNLVKWNDGPYNQMLSPFGSDKRLTAGEAEVKNAIFKAEVAISAEQDKSQSAVAGAVNGAGVASVLLADTKRNSEGVNASETKAGSQLAKNQINQGLVGGPRAPLIGGGGPTLTVVAAAPFKERPAGGRIDALTCVRYKTYGLVELDIDKVRALDVLEEAIAEDLDYNGEGSAVWRGSMERVLGAFGPVFGIEGTENSNAYDWRTWFAGRFLPTFLNYATALKRSTGKDGLKQGIGALKPIQAIDVAQVILTTNGSYNGGAVSVWEIPVSPWPKYVLNRDSKSTEANIQALKNAAQKLAFQEVQGTENTAKSATEKQSLQDSINERFKKESIDFAKNPSMLQSTVDKANANAFKKGTDWMYVAGKGQGLSMLANQTPFSGGSEVTHPGNGTGGDVNSLPTPNGDGSWAAMKDLILAASKMAGVDPHLMATMAAIESGFRAKVKAGTSSATGLYQFLTKDRPGKPSTWTTMLNRYGAKYGIAPNTPATDARANALMGAEFIKENVNALKKVLKRPVTDTDAYIAHFMGAGGASRFLSADPNAIGAQLMPEAAASNENIYFDTVGGGRRPRTIAQIYQLLNNKVRTEAAKHGVSIPAAAPEPKVETPNIPGITPMAPAANDAGTTELPSLFSGNNTATQPTTETPATPAAEEAPKEEAPKEEAAKPTQPVSPIGVLPVPQRAAAAAAPLVMAKPAQDTAQPKKPSQQAPEEPIADEGAAAFGAGFSSSIASTARQNRDIVEQRRYAEEVQAQSIGKVEETLRSSLSIQEQQLEVLKLILKATGNIRVSGESQKDTQPQKQQSASVSNQSRNQAGMPNVPVTLKRSM